MTQFLLTLHAQRRRSRRGPSDEVFSILGLAAPVASVSLVNMAMSFTDTVMAASLGPKALAAVSLGGDAAGIVAVLAIGAIGGVAPAHARPAAAGDLSGLAALCSASWALAALIALVTFPVIWSGTSILSALGLPGQTQAEGQGYIRAMAVNVLPLLALAVLRNRATGERRTV